MEKSSSASPLATRAPSSAMGGSSRSENLWGEKTPAHGSGRPPISPDRMRAAAIELLMPHLPKPVATYQFGVEVQ